MKRVYLVRHGESVGNAAKQHQDSMTELSDIGISQAKMLAHRCGKLDTDEIICSDYVRTRQTADHILAIQTKPISYSPLFRERKFPKETENKAYSYSGSQPIKKAMYDHRHDPDWHYSDEENLFDMNNRGIEAVEYLTNRESHSILVVTHGAFLRMIIWSMWHKDLAFDVDAFLSFDNFFKTNNTGISMCEHDDNKWILYAFNDHAHLG